MTTKAEMNPSSDTISPSARLSYLLNKTGLISSEQSVKLAAKEHSREELIVQVNKLPKTEYREELLDLLDETRKTHFRQELLGLLNETGVLNKFSAETSRSCGLSFFAGVKIDGMGVLALPVTPAVAAAVKQVCKVAPHGKGLETVIDMDVRRAFQIDSTKVTLSDELRKVVDNMVGECMDTMGVHGKVEAVLYKLLFYEKKGHFDWHRDTVRGRCGAYSLRCVRGRMGTRG